MIEPREVADQLLSVKREGAEGKQIPPFSELHRDFDIEAAYDAQRFVVQAATAAGETIVGARLARTGLAADRAEHPLYGLATSGMLAPYGEALVSAALRTPMVAPQLGLLLAEDVPVPATVAGVLSVTGGVFGAIDVLDTRYARPGTAADLVADNCSAGKLLVGPDSRHPSDVVDLRLLGCVLRSGGEVVATAAGAAALGHPAAAAAWLANELAKRDEPLPAGWLIFTGPLTAPVPLVPGRSVTAEFDGLGAVEAYLASPAA